MANRIDWTQKFNFGGPRDLSKIIGVCIHTTENKPGTPAKNVAQYQIDSESGSYHKLVDTSGTVLIENTDDWVAWATGNKGNYILLHLSFVFYAAATREEWLAQMPMLEAGAREVAEWCRIRRIPTRWSPTVDRLPGITSHSATRAWGGTDHTDPGAGFPWDVFIDLVIRAGEPAPVKEEKTMTVSYTHLTLPTKRIV